MKIKVKLSAVNDLRASLQSLDGWQKVVGEKVVFVPYVFKELVTRKKIVNNLRVLKAQVEDLEARKIALVAEIADPATPGFVDEMDGPRQSAFALKWREIKNELVEIDGLMPIDIEELSNENRNPIPSTILEAVSVLEEVKKETE